MPSDSIGLVLNVCTSGVTDSWPYSVEMMANFMNSNFWEKLHWT